MAEKINAYMLRLNDVGMPCKGYIGEIENSLEAKQKYVKGLIQVVSLNSQIDIICNDEGKLIGLEPNRAFMDGEDILDIFVGDILACRHDAGGNFTSIKEEDIPIIESMLLPIRIVVGNTVFLAGADTLDEYKQERG